MVESGEWASERLQLLSYCIGAKNLFMRPSDWTDTTVEYEELHDLFSERNVSARRDQHGRIMMDYTVPCDSFFTSYEYALGTSIFLEHLSVNLRAYNTRIAPRMPPLASHMALYFWSPTCRSAPPASIQAFKRQKRVLLTTHGFTVRLIGPGENGPMPTNTHTHVIATLLDTLNKHHPDRSHQLDAFCELPDRWEGESVVIANVRDLLVNLKRDLAKELAAKAATRVAAGAVSNVLKAAREGKLVRPRPPPNPEEALAAVIESNRAAANRREATLEARAKVARVHEKAERCKANKAAVALAKAVAAQQRQPTKAPKPPKSKSKKSPPPPQAPHPLAPAAETDAERISRITAEATAAEAAREEQRTRAAQAAAEAREAAAAAAAAAAAVAPQAAEEEDEQFEMDLQTAMALSLREPPSHFKTWLKPSSVPCRYGGACKFRDSGCIFVHPPKSTPSGPPLAEYKRQPREQWVQSEQPCRFSRAECKWGARCVFRHDDAPAARPEPVLAPKSLPSSPEPVVAAVAAVASMALVDECAVCLDKPKCMLSFACMHMAVCETCAAQLDKCVLCNAPTAFGKVFK